MFTNNDISLSHRNTSGFQVGKNMLHNVEQTVKMKDYTLFLRVKACEAKNGKYHSTEETNVKFSCKQLNEIDCLSTNQNPGCLF